jgi:hypothetical protein
MRDGNLQHQEVDMYGDIILFSILAFVVYFFGNYGHSAGWWGYRVYVFGFTTVAGLLFAMGLMNYLFPSLSTWGKIVIAAGATVGAVVVSLVILKLISKKI